MRPVARAMSRLRSRSEQSENDTLSDPGSLCLFKERCFGDPLRLCSTQH